MDGQFQLILVTAQQMEVQVQQLIQVIVQISSLANDNWTLRQSIGGTIISSPINAADQNASLARYATAVQALQITIGQLPTSISVTIP